ncbi:MAG: rhodanese-like domain-containing protein [Elusimicrobia bacterium]|nr:rhodanese-like domain-containing protein [Elusimicrobiota bacterium]
MHKLVSFLILATSPAWSADTKTHVDDLRRLQLVSPQNLVIIDVRPPSDFAKGHIQGSRNIPVKNLAAARLPLDSKIIVYCGEDSCPLGEQAAKSLISVGHRDVQTLVVGRSS